jgi:hypothetical protein
VRRHLRSEADTDLIQQSAAEARIAFAMAYPCQAMTVRVLRPLPDRQAGAYWLHCRYTHLGDYVGVGP